MTLEASFGTLPGVKFRYAYGARVLSLIINARYLLGFRI